MAALRPDLAEEDAERMAIVLPDAIDGIIHNAPRRGALPSSASRLELVRLMSAYVAPDAPPP